MACPSPSSGRAAVTNLVTNLELRGDHEPIGRLRRRLLAPPRAPACNQGDHQWQSVAISGNQRQSSGSELLHELHLPIVVVVVVVIIGCGSECRDQLAVRGVGEESVRPQQRAQLVGGEAPKTARARRRVGRHVTRC